MNFDPAPLETSFSPLPSLEIKEMDNASSVEVFTITPSRKPVYKKPVVSHSLGISKKTVITKPIEHATVEATSLMPSSPSLPKVMPDNAPPKLESSIAFLPASVDLTNRQKELFKGIMQTYFIERDAKKIIITVYASHSSEEERAAKRKALARGLNVRDWLLGLGLTADQIVLKAIGKADKGTLPDRADIEIVI